MYNMFFSFFINTLFIPKREKGEEIAIFIVNLSLLGTKENNNKKIVYWCNNQGLKFGTLHEISKCALTEVVNTP